MLNPWLQQWFDGGSAAIARRAVSDVDRLATVEDAVAEARRRGWHIIETEDQLVLFRHDGHFQILC